MFPDIIVKLLFAINCLLCISYGEDLSSQMCKSAGSSWRENGTEYRSLLYRNELYAYAICQVGYTLTSSSKVLCVNGYWENLLPRCERKSLSSRRCKPEGSSWIEYGTEYRSIAYHNELYAFAICPVDFTFSRSNRVRCVNGYWSNPLPRCERVASRQCEPLPSSRMVIRACSKEPHSGVSVCRYRCPNQYFLSGSWERRCGRNSQWTGVEPQCILKDDNIDECQFPDLNQCNQKCINTPLSYLCSCKSGYALKNNYECDDINECFHNNFGCSHSCINTPGSALCSCPLGFQLKNNNKTCVDIDECQSPDLNQCNQKCINTPGSFSCSCRHGYALKNNHKCEDIDECQFPDLHQCNQKCVNTPGSYLCSCEAGYTLKNNYKCDDIDECQFPHLRRCNLKCINTNGSYSCSCEYSYTLENSYKCEDIDECQFPELNQCNQKCINTLGSYSCSCESGYILRNNYKCEET